MMSLNAWYENTGSHIPVAAVILHQYKFLEWKKY